MLASACPNDKLYSKWFSLHPDQKHSMDPNAFSSEDQKLKVQTILEFI